MRAKGTFYFTVGLGVLALNKARYALGGYRRPRSFSTSDLDRCLAYDAEVITGWERFLTNYTGDRQPLAGRTILELGPGADIGVGAMLLDRGASSYWALDKHDLMRQMPADFCIELLKRLESDEARRALEAFVRREPGRLNYVVDPAFDLERLAAVDIDLVVSQAAFEHFDFARETIEQLSRIVRSGGVLCAEIDLQTHSRWIRERDPNNIYRFPGWLYQRLHYAGIPNRVRPEQYRDALIEHGWKDVTIIPRQQVRDPDCAHTLYDLAEPFAASDMRTLTCVVLATRG